MLDVAIGKAWSHAPWWRKVLGVVLILSAFIPVVDQIDGFVDVVLVAADAASVGHSLYQAYPCFKPHGGFTRSAFAACWETLDFIEIRELGEQTKWADDDPSTVAKFVKAFRMGTDAADYAYDDIGTMNSIIKTSNLGYQR